MSSNPVPGDPVKIVRFPAAHDAAHGRRGPASFAASFRSIWQNSSSSAAQSQSCEVDEVRSNVSGRCFGLVPRACSAGSAHLRRGAAIRSPADAAPFAARIHR